MITITVMGKTIAVKDTAQWNDVRGKIDALFASIDALGCDCPKAVRLPSQRGKVAGSAKSGTVRDYAAKVLASNPNGLTATNIANAILTAGWTTRATTMASISALIICELRRCRELGFSMDANKMWHYAPPATTSADPTTETEETN